MKKSNLLAIAAFATCMVMGGSAFADPGHGRDRDRHDNGNHYGHYKKYDNYRYDRWDNYGRDYRFNGNERVVYRRAPVVVIRPSDRVVIREYYHTYPVVYRPSRPAWQVGYALPRNVRYERIPTRLMHRLQPVPVGYEYVQVDGNVLLIQDATRLIVDAITLL